jgi:hypothetical protein
MIGVSNLETEITNIGVNLAIFVSCTSNVINEVMLNVIIVVIVIINLTLRQDPLSSVFDYCCRCLQRVITLMDVSDAQLSSGRLRWRHVT